MEIEYSLTEADILALMQFRLQHSKGRRNPVTVRRWAYLAGFGLVALGSLILGKDVVLSVVFLVLAVAFFLLYPLYFNRLIRRKVSQTYRDEKMRASLSSRTLKATDEGLEEKSELGEMKVKWLLVDGIYPTSTHVFISVQKNLSIIIPRDRLSSGDIESFLQSCQNHLQPAVHQQ